MSLPKPYLVRTGLDEILDGLHEGDAFPPERELAARFQVARETVRQAVHELLVEGHVAVAPENEEPAPSQERLCSACRQLGAAVAGSIDHDPQ